MSPRPLVAVAAAAGLALAAPAFAAGTSTTDPLKDMLPTSSGASVAEGLRHAATGPIGRTVGVVLVSAAILLVRDTMARRRADQRVREAVLRRAALHDNPFPQMVSTVALASPMALQTGALTPSWPTPAVGATTATAVMSPPIERPTNATPTTWVGSDDWPDLR